MNKLLLNHRARNHIRFFPMKDAVNDIPSDPALQIKWCQEEFKRLQHSESADRLFLEKHRGLGYMITVWEMNGLYYLIHCLRNEFKTFNTTIYISKNKDDMLSIAKFLKDNIVQIMSDYKSQILEARDALVKAKIEEQIDNTGENNDA